MSGGMLMKQEENQEAGRWKWRIVKPWLGVAGLFGAGLLPCPDCGKPMILHFWPLALILSLRNLIRHRKRFTESDQEQTRPQENFPNGIPE